MNARQKLFSSEPWIGALIFAAFLAAGCTTVKKTEPARTATEQLLLSTATDHALHSANFGFFANRKVFLDATYFDSYDSKNVLGTIRDAMSRAGALLADSASNSDIIIEARSGALSIDSSEFLVGVPNMAVPVPLAGSVTIPELALYKSDKEHSVANISLLAYARETRAHVYSSGPLHGNARNDNFKLLFAISWHRTDVPQKQDNWNKETKYETWFPQYDALPTNAPATNLSPVSLPATNAPPVENISTNQNTL